MLMKSSMSATTYLNLRKHTLIMQSSPAIYLWVTTGSKTAICSGAHNQTENNFKADYSAFFMVCR